MIRTFERNPVLGNLVLAFIFGGVMLVVTLLVFNGHPQMMLYAGICGAGMLGIFFAATAYDRDHQPDTLNHPYLAQRQPKKRRQSRAYPGAKARPANYPHRNFDYAR
ncbi:MAG: hypothetical protein D6675_00050 [Gemmatimonadetes bacterium]|nr:MAG: hypothetical protein D6675_00050 [Gemmatimonadota bacterium]